MIAIASIVEGHGEVEAVPELIRRFAAHARPSLYVQALRPTRVPKSSLERELERLMKLCAIQIDQLETMTGGILIVLDADDDCPAQLGPRLLERARQVRADIPTVVVIAKSEYESWFLAAAESLQGRRGLPNNLSSPLNPEGIRDAKGWLGDRMGPRGYSETVDQVKLSAVFDLEEARRSQSFARCYDRLVNLFDELKGRYDKRREV
jgi:hypothetical protein